MTSTTLDERVDIIIDNLSSATESEFDALSASGFTALLSTLEKTFEGASPYGEPESLSQKLRREFEIEEGEELDTERLRLLDITPHDLLYTLSNEEIRTIRDKLGVSRRGDSRLHLIELFANANDKLIEHYADLARRDLAALKAAGIEIPEGEIGQKFEEITRTILEGLGLTVDEEFRKAVSTPKDRPDIILSIGEEDVIIGEAKTCKRGDFAKYSTTSRQVKAYSRRCENQGRRVLQVLIIAPSFSDDFVESAEMDTEVNISLLTASGLKLIYDAYTAKRHPNFSANLLTKGGLLKAELIARNI